MTKETELSALERNLAEATETYARADKAYELARKDRTNAQNALNAAQRQMDACLKKLREGAPRESDWGADRLRATAREVA
jgi:hypothetical protein